MAERKVQTIRASAIREGDVLFLAAGIGSGETEHEVTSVHEVKGGFVRVGTADGENPMLSSGHYAKVARKEVSHV